MSYDERLGDYNDVASRMREFFEKYPDGRLRPNSPWRFETVGDKAFVVYEAAAYRAPDDPLPGIGTAWEPFPGRTPYTKDSELMNAETSAWGRAILAVGAADTKKGIASQEEVRNRQADREHQPEPQTRWPSPVACVLFADAGRCVSADALRVVWDSVQAAGKAGDITAEEASYIKAHIKQRGEEVAKPAEPQPVDEPVEDRTAEPVEVDGQQPMDADWPEAARPGNPT